MICTPYLIENRTKTTYQRLKLGNCIIAIYAHFEFDSNNVIYILLSKRGCKKELTSMLYYSLALYIFPVS